MKRGFKNIWVRCLILLVGLTIAHFGVTLFILTNLGSDPFNVLVQGVNKTFGGALNWSVITHGNVHITLCFTIIIALLFTDRSYIKIGTVLCMIFGGPIIDAFTLIFKDLFATTHSIVIDISVCCLACVILAFGMSIVIKSDAGTGPNDLVSQVLSDKMKKKFSIVRIITDAAFVVIGLVLGGTAGIGTLICVFVVGPVAGFIMPLCEKIINKIVKD